MTRNIKPQSGNAELPPIYKDMTGIIVVNVDLDTHAIISDKTYIELCANLSATGEILNNIAHKMVTSTQVKDTATIFLTDLAELFKELGASSVRMDKDNTIVHKGLLSILVSFVRIRHQFSAVVHAALMKMPENRDNQEYIEKHKKYMDRLDKLLKQCIKEFGKELSIDPYQFRIEIKLKD